MAPNKILLRGILAFLVVAVSAAGGSRAFGSVRLAFDSASLDFGSVAVFGSKDLIIQTWDTATVPIKISQITVSIDANEFSVLSPLSATVVSPGAALTTQIIVQFNPQVLGTRTGSLLIETTDGNVIIPLTGTGAGNKASLAWSLDRVDFGTITPGGERDSVIELYSTGTDTAMVDGIQLAAGDTSFAEQVAGGVQPPFKLAPGDSVAVQIAFRGLPLLGLKNAQLSAISSSSDIPSAMLTGDVELGSFKIRPPAKIDFGPMYAGQIRDSTIFLINTSALDLRDEDLSLSPSGDDFTITSPVTLPFTLGGADTVAITIRANPGNTTSHTAQLHVFSPSADTTFRSARVTAQVTPAPIAAPSSQKLNYYCASGSAILDTISITDTGSQSIIITGLTFADTTVHFVANISFPDTPLSGSTQNLILDLNFSMLASDTQVLEFLGGEKVMLADTIALHPSVANVGVSATITSSNDARQTIAVAASAPLTEFDLDSIIVHLDVLDSNVAAIDPASITLTASLVNASIASILPEVNGYAVTIFSTSPISAGAGQPLLDFALDRFVAASDSTNISVAMETPERVGCIAWSADTTQVGGFEACGSSELRNALLQRPLILSATMRQEPVRTQNAQLMINASREDDARFTLSNALGEIASGGSVHLLSGSHDYSLPVSNLASGTYVIRLLPADGAPVSVWFL